MDNQPENIKPVTKKTNPTFNLLTFIPITGIFGFHDLYIKRYKQFALHVFMAIVAAALNIVVPIMVANHLFSTSTKGYITMPSDPVYVFFCDALPTLIFIGLYVWGIIENRHFIKTQVAPETFSPDILPEQRIMEQRIDVNNETNNKNFSAISFFLSLIPILVWSYTLTRIIVNINEIRAPGFSGGMVVIIAPLFYYSTFGIGFVIGFFSISFAIKGLKIEKQKRLAIASLVLKGITVALIIATFVAPSVLP